MYYYNGHIDDFLNGVINDVIGLREFENWITTNKELLEDYIGMNEYQRLLTIDYTTENAINHVKEQVKLILDTPTYDHDTMCALLSELLEHEDAYVKCCRQIYEHYCNGFDFFKDIALTAICYDYDHRLEQPDDLEGFFKEREFIVKEAAKILEYLKSGEIRIVRLTTTWIEEIRAKGCKGIIMVLIRMISALVTSFIISLVVVWIGNNLVNQSETNLDSTSFIVELLVLFIPITFVFLVIAVPYSLFVDRWMKGLQWSRLN